MCFLSIIADQFSVKQFLSNPRKWCFFFLYNFTIWSKVSLYTAWSGEETYWPIGFLLFLFYFLLIFFFSWEIQSGLAGLGRTIRIHYIFFSFMGICILAKDQLILMVEYFWCFCYFPLDLMLVLWDYHSTVINWDRLA